MLTLKNITKDYYLGKKNTKNYQIVHALRDVSINFRKHELVSILGQSGCGKTTLLNIIGGLDQYTSGDLLINNISTKEYMDRDWDNYRNHSIGFIFQSYNLIPHQSVLVNVELALTLSGVSREERKRRAIEALEKVGLGDKIHSNPNQLSGGQMQRVAIARALVNDPEIILADEPTGALDSKTSVQIMDILKEISSEKLIIMVTHNPDLAREYSTRIIELFDGKVMSDSRPYEPIDCSNIENILDPNKKNLPDGKLTNLIKPDMLLEDVVDILGKPQRVVKENDLEKVEFDLADGKKLVMFIGNKVKPNKKVGKKKTRMSFFTALSLSIKNLLTKKARTALVSFAGSIGIIGIALVLSMSSGFQNYINKIQEETLSTYPISINSRNSDMSSLLNMFAEQRDSDVNHEFDAVYSNNIFSKIVQSIQASIKSNDLATFKKFLETDEEAKSIIVDGNIAYSYNVDLQIYKDENSTEKVTNNIFGMSSGSDSMMMANMDIWSQMIDNRDLINRQYDVLAGEMPTSYDEIVVILDDNNEINDFVLYGLGLISEDEFNNIRDNPNVKPIKISYETILEQTYIILPSAFYYELGNDNIALDKRSNANYLKEQLSSNNAIKLKVSGIIKPKSENVGKVLSGVIGYSSDLTRNVIYKNNNSPVARYQMEHPDINVFTGHRFEEDETIYTRTDLINYFASLISDSANNIFQNNYDFAQYIYDGLCRWVLINFIESNEQFEQALMLYYMTSDTGFSSFKEFASYYKSLPVDSRVDLLRDSIDTILIGFYSSNLDEVNERASYENNINELGICDENVPSQINIYATDFKNKEDIVRLIEKYNKLAVDNGHEEESISYTDYVGLLMSSVSTIIDIISTVLIVFVGISLVVSSIMIGVITYISVLERIKEIGILRSIGASKQDIKRVFTAESVTIGFLAGAVGILVTSLILIPGNIILKYLTDISHLANLPIVGAIILILVSIFMTFVAGLLPANLASKKDPVVALRTE
ncbi:MAG: ABC transporter ATP-binding protein/permease [Erysipelotrichales bacterium]|nr:ABC transporter ATP-binding protein/permease [Erysipelotrichales bacterium]